MYQRYVSSKIETALQDTPAIMLIGPRQSGKTTLIKQLIDQDHTYVTLDNLVQYQFATSDPIGFIRHFSTRHIIIDEIQRAPQLMLPIKEAIDENRQPGRFLLTGSANAMALPRVADSLAGRIESIRLHPLSECEIQDRPSTFLQKLLDGQPPETRQVRTWDQWVEKARQGGFPEVIGRSTDARQYAWFEQYITSIIQKDMKDLAEIQHLHIMPRLIQAFCEQVGQLTNLSEIAKRLQLPRPTIRRYLQLLEQLFIFQELPAWHGNTYKRLVKTPKMHITDSGLLCALKKITHHAYENNRSIMGHILENYVLCEIQRLASWLDQPLYFYHYRDKDQIEVNLVIETMQGDVIGIEIKAAATIQHADFQGLERLKKAAGKQFKMGLLLYDGDHTNAAGDKLYATPIASLWE